MDDSMFASSPDSEKIPVRLEGDRSDVGNQIMPVNKTVALGTSGFFNEYTNGASDSEGRPVPTIDGETSNFLNMDANRALQDENLGTILLNKSVAISSETLDGENDNDVQHWFSEGRAVCRVLASSDGKLPTAKKALPRTIQEPPYILEKLDAIYHAISHDETRRLAYMERPYLEQQSNATSYFDEKEERKLVSVLRNSLEDAGFELLSKRDIDLCEALNAAYLLRIAIAPDVSKMDGSIVEEFYPERFSSEGNDTDKSEDSWPFGGRVLVYRRGYSSEVTKGRLLVPKLDYLQASVVQRSASAVTERIGRIEQRILEFLSVRMESIQQSIRKALLNAVDCIQNEKVASLLRNKLLVQRGNFTLINIPDSANTTDSFFKLDRYGGRQSRFRGAPMDALDPFITCQVGGGDTDENLGIPVGAEGLSCPYDLELANSTNTKFVPLDPGVLLERVSINNVVDLSTRTGKRSVLSRFFSPSELVEPTYEEVVAIWRPLPVARDTKLLRPLLRPPKVAYDFAEIFGVDDRLPEVEDSEPEPGPSPLEIRTFDAVPMANVQAVLPKTKLLFRPADAFVFDLISLISFLAIFSSQRFDSPKLDLLAVVSGSIWLVRLLIRYSNKLARYDLLVNKFLTSKISHRNSGALKYITREAGTQRATRASLVYMWLVQRMSETEEPVTRSQLVQEGAFHVNHLLFSSTCVRVDVDAALNDLEDLNVIRFIGEPEQELQRISDQDKVVEDLMSTWVHVFEGKMSFKSLMGRREHPFKSWS